MLYKGIQLQEINLMCMDLDWGEVAGHLENTHAEKGMLWGSWANHCNTALSCWRRRFYYSHRFFFTLHTKTTWTWNHWGRGLESGWTWNHWGWNVRVSKLPWTGAHSILGVRYLAATSFPTVFLCNQGMNQKLSDSRPTTTDLATVVNTLYFHDLFFCVGF